MKKSFKVGLMSLSIVLVVASAFTSKSKFAGDFWYFSGTTTFIEQAIPSVELTNVQTLNSGNGHTYSLSGGTGFHAYEKGFTTKNPNGTLDATVFESN